MKHSQIIIVAVLCFFSVDVFGQTVEDIRAKKIEILKQKIEADLTEIEDLLTRPDTSIITGHFAQAQVASMRPDAKYIGVYLMIDDGYDYAVDELVLPIKSYFDYYELPVVLVKQDVPFNGVGASMVVFVNGKSVMGEQKAGDFSLFEVQKNHEDVFQKIKSCYALAQQGLFGSE